MKRIAIVLLIAAVATGAVAAQGYWGTPAPAAAAQTIVKIEGKLALVQGHPAIVVKDKTYFVQMPQLVYGFIDGLVEGATVKLEGYEQAVPLAANSFYYRVTKLTFGGKDYDLSQMAGGMMGGRGMMGGMDARGGMMGGRGGRGGW